MKNESQSTQQLVEIQEIKNGVVFLKGGGLRKVLMTSGINMDLKSDEEQAAITYIYQNFLNSLDFSVQFVIHSRKINIEGYLNILRERHEQENNELLKNQISEYIEFIRSFVEANAVMSKNFFVVVPYDPTIIPTGGGKLFDFFKFGKKESSSQKQEESAEKKFVQLNQRTEEIINGLSQLGLRVVALNDEELIELFYNLYNPQTIEKKDLKIAHNG